MPPVTTSDNPEELARLMTADPGLPRSNPTPAYWQHIPHPLANTQSKRLHSQRHYAIIGSGVTGLSVAKTVLENHPTATVSVLEARSLCSGATGRNGGQMAANAGEEYMHLAEVFGSEMAGKIANFTLRNLDAMHALVEEFDAVETSEVQRLKKLRVFMTEAKFEDFKGSLARLEADHPTLKGMYTLVDANTLLEVTESSLSLMVLWRPISTPANIIPIVSFSRVEQTYSIHGACGGALLSAGTVWPYRLVTKVFDTLLKRYPGRFAIETHTPVLAVEVDHISSSASPAACLYSVHTARGSITVDHVIYCTNGYSGHLLPALRGPIYPFKGTMTVQDPGTLIRNQGNCVSWGFHYPPSFDPVTKRHGYGLYYLGQSAKSGYLYFGGENKRIDDAVSADDSFVATSSVEHLQSSLPRFFAKTDEVSPPWKLVSSWSGIMGFTSDGLPMVGQLSSSLTGRKGEGEWIAAGFNGYGMANCFLCGEALALMMLGKPRPDWLPEAYQISEERVAAHFVSKEATTATGSKL
ncbi:Uncharacterized protein PECH_007170 [Penicillium ucsense]|uniref:FAD dependent oxidoreductase domain-containing protein n=1 Tax=Penicillium ucsense TaxID=2839758 RepID=A0A8J8WLN0_9EURO|nr:Uncharacterized protein PECM_000779 [Penicillium ucsense]KAF7735102.1 Uncharacterized protein PECH_007170 [Penicillium ucsense]